MEGAVQQTGFRREKRLGVPRDILRQRMEDDNAAASPWQSIRQALDAEDAMMPDPHVVHDEQFFDRMQYSANHKWVLHKQEKRSNCRFIFVNLFRRI